MNSCSHRWQPRALVISMLMAAFLFLSYLVHGPADLWYTLDVHVAFNLNGLVETSQLQQWIWAIGSLRLFDDAMAVIMLLLLVHYVFRAPNATRSVRAAQAVV